MSEKVASQRLSPELLRGLRDTALFYPCSGNDLSLPIELFSQTVSDFFFVDIRKPRRPDLRPFAVPASARLLEGPEVFVDVASDRSFRVHRHQHRAEEYVEQLPKLGVFFFRGDNPVNGEGSSGVLWLGRDLFSQVLKLLVPGGLVVTDGSNPGPDGPKHLSDFYHNREVGEAAASKAVQFNYNGRHFRCVGYAGQKNGPTLIWQVQ